MNAIFKQNYTPELFIAFEILYSCCFGLRGKLDFQISSKKSFITSTPSLGIVHENCIGSVDGGWLEVRFIIIGNRLDREKIFNN